ncbi:MAG: glutamate racemase, partial [Eubacteriales bacterium]|nr:glutamate racemase [Eubacteriales bacterium]
MDRNAPIGVFDSGIGGVSVLKQCLSLMPRENYIFFGDDAHCPYGEKTNREIVKLTEKAVEYLVDRGVKAVVIACNTATAAAIETVRSLFAIPIVGIEPAVKPALEQTAEGRVLVMATPATVRQKKFMMLVEKLDTQNRIDLMSCDGLAAGGGKKKAGFLTAEE